MRRSTNPIWARWESALPVFRRDKLDRGSSTLARLRDVGILQPTTPASDWWCQECGELHQIDYHDFPSGKQAIVECPFGPIRLAGNQTDQYRINTTSMLAWLFADSRVSIAEPIPSHLWNIGRHTIDSKSCELWLVRIGTQTENDRIVTALATHPKAIALTPTQGSAALLQPKLACMVIALADVVDLSYDNASIDWQRVTQQYTAHHPTAKPAPPRRKRGTRTAKIERLRDELKRHLVAAADHAVATSEGEGYAELLPRPSKTDLAKLTGLTKSDVTRCFNDETATELCLLYQTADDLEQVLRLRGRATFTK